MRSFEGSVENLEPVPTGIFRPPSSSSKAEGGGFSWSPSEEYSVDPEAKKRESARSNSRQSSIRDGGGVGTGEEIQYHIAAVVGDSLEDSYYLIDANPQFPVGVDVPGNRFLDVNALASKLASLEVTQQHRTGEGAVRGDSNASRVPGVVGGGTQGGENLSEGATGFTQISLGGGSAHTVTVKVEKKGTAISWEFSSEPKGLAFGLSFEEDTEGAKNEQVYIF